MIREVSESLIDVIHRATPDMGAWMVLHSLSAGEKTAPPETKGVLALVAVEEHPHLRNRPLVEGRTGLIRAPLSLRLSYVATCFGDHDECQHRLGRIVQAFHTTPTLRAPELGPPLAAAVGSIGIRLTGPTHDQRNQIWGALGRAGRLALFYEVDVAPIPVIERESTVRVREHRIDYAGAP